MLAILAQFNRLEKPVFRLFFSADFCTLRRLLDRATSSLRFPFGTTRLLIITKIRKYGVIHRGGHSVTTATLRDIPSEPLSSRQAPSSAPETRRGAVGLAVTMNLRSILLACLAAARGTVATIGQICQNVPVSGLLAKFCSAPSADRVAQARGPGEN